MRLLVALAERQHGVVEHGQLAEHGFTRHRIAHLVRSGFLRRVHRGVYAVGGSRLTQRGRWMAAVLAGGSGAVLSHRSAAALFGLRVVQRKIEVTAPKDRRRGGLKIYVTDLPPDERTTRDGIPVTTAARMLLDLAAVESAHKVERALHEAERLRLTDATPLAALLARYPRRPGTPTIRRVLSDHTLGDDVTESELEDAFLVFLDEYHLPRPLLNRWLQIGEDRIRADALYPDQRLIIELDGGSHRTANTFETDRRRDRRLRVLGFETVRITWRELHTNRDELADDLRRLAASG